MKQLILVRTDLKMKKGKIAAQVAHASMGSVLEAVSLLSKNDNEWQQHPLYASPNHWTYDTMKWLNGSFTKICLKVSSLEELEKYEKQAQELNLLNCKITDNGDTVFNGIPTVTCLAIGPAHADDLSFTSELKLL